MKSIGEDIVLFGTQGGNTQLGQKPAQHGMSVDHILAVTSHSFLESGMRDSIRLDLKQ